MTQTYPSQDYAGAGLEDFDPDELSAPRLRIQHDEGVFVHSQTGEKLDRLDAVILGVVKQRTFFPPQIQDGGKPFCKSPDGKTGFPNLSSDPEKAFPWEGSGFDKDQFDKDAEGRIHLPCSACIYKDWQGNKTPPPCAEQYTMPIMYYERDETGGGTYVPAILTLQKSSIKPARTYISAFVQRSMPLFSVVTIITLRMDQRGSVKYSVPDFEKSTAIPPASFPGYYDTYNALRGYLQKAPRVPGAIPLELAPAARQAQIEAVQPAPAAPAAAPPPPAPPTVDVWAEPAPAPTGPPSDPWAEPAAPAPVPVSQMAAAPAQSPTRPAPAPAPAPAAPVTVVDAPPPFEVATVAPAPAPPPPPPAAAAPAATMDDDDDLPF